MADSPLPIPGATTEGERKLVAQMYRELSVTPVFENPETPIYHYTSVATFEKILRSRKIWATDYRRLRDAREFVGGDHLVLDVIKSLAASPQQSEPSRRFFDALVSNIDHLGFTKIMGQVFVASFCDFGDDVAQWREFGGRGEGVCFGLSWRPPESIEAMGGQRLGATMLKVQYDEAALRDTIEKRLITIALGALHYIDIHPQHAELLGKHSLLIAGRSTSYLVPAIKQPIYRSEAERRIVAMPFRDAAPSLVKTDAGTDRQHVEVPLAPDVKTPIALHEVFTGWIGDAKGRLTEVRKILEGFGYDPNVAKPSKVEEH
jgi:hypothetical protein